MAFELAKDKPSDDIAGETIFDMADFNGRLSEEKRASSLDLIERYYSLKPTNNNRAEAGPQPETVFAEPGSPLEQAEPIAEDASGASARDNGLGIMVIDTPAEQPIAQPISIETVETERQPRFQKITFDRLSFRGIKRAISVTRELPSEFGRAVSANLVTSLNGLSEKLTLAEHKTARKRIAFAALGGLAVAAAAYTAHKTGLGFGTSRSHETVQQTLPIKATPHHAVESIQPRLVPAAPVHAPIRHTAPAVHHHAVHRAAAHVKYQTEALKFRGDTVWNHVQARIQAKYGHLSQAKLTELTAQFTNKTLGLNHLTSAAARHMSLGQKFKISL